MKRPLAVHSGVSDQSLANPRVEQRNTLPPLPLVTALCGSSRTCLLGHPFASSRPLHILETARHPVPEGEKRRLTRVPSPAPSPRPSAPDATRSPGSTPAVTSCFTPAHVALHHRPRPFATGESCLESKVSGSQPSVRAGTEAGGQEQSPPPPPRPQMQSPRPRAVLTADTHPWKPRGSYRHPKMGHFGPVLIYLMLSTSFVIGPNGATEPVSLWATF